MTETVQTSAVTRAHGWEGRLRAEILRERALKFAWGVSDCCLTACNLMRAVGGIDLAALFRGRYSDELGAGRAMKNFAGGGVEELAAKVAEQFGLPEVKPALARRGDCLLFDGELFEGGRGPMLGIVDLDGMHALVRVIHGLERVPVLAARRAWRIG